MGEGQDKVARSLLDLEPSAILDLFLVYPDYNNQPDEIFAIHNGSLFKKGVVWQGRTYMPIGLEIDGFEVNADGRINRPKIKVSNKDYFVTSLLKKFNNFQSARIVQKRTFVKYLDDENFDGGNPFGQSNSSAEISSQQYIVAQKTQENKIFVEFELTSPLDLDNFELNHRRIMGKYCYWKYRGIGCRYAGPPIHRENGRNFKDVDGNNISLNQNQIDSFGYGNLADEYSKDKQYEAGDIVFIRGNSESEEGDIYNYYVAKTQIQGLRPDENPKYWDKDGCNKKLSSCKVHFPKAGTITRFVGLVDVEIDTARFIPETTSLNHMKPVSWYTPRYMREGPIHEWETNDQWTLAFNLKNIKYTAAINGIFSTAFGSDWRHHLIIEDNVFKYIVWTSSSRNQIIPSLIRNFGTEGLNNHPIIIGQKDTSTVFMYEPSFNSYYEYNLGSPVWKDRNIHEDFVIGNWSPNSLPDASTKMDIDSICFWTKALTRAEMDQLYRKPVDGGLRAKKYLDIQTEIAEGLTPATVLEQVENWWEGAFFQDTETTYANYNFSSYNGIRDLIKQDDLIVIGGNAGGGSPYTNRPEATAGSFAIDTNTYQYNIEETVTIGEEGVYLPFGGFPGTDGFEFSRDA